MMDIFIGDLYWRYILFLLGLLIFLAYWFLTRNFNYWETRNVPYIKPTLFFGSTKNVLLKRTSWKSLLEKWYVEFKNVGIGGAYFFTQPVAFVCDVELVEKVLIEDFSYFRDRFQEYNPKIPLANSLTHSTGDRWRELHLKIAPTFTSLKIKGMIQQIFECTDEITAQIRFSIEKNDPLPLENLSFLYTFEVIGRCMFGAKLFTNSAEGKVFQSTLDLVYNPSFLNSMFYSIATFYPKLINLLKIDLLPKKVTELFFQLTRKIIEQRRDMKIRRNDYLQILLDLKEQEDLDNDGINLNKERLFTDQSIPVLMFNFLLAGLKSTSTTLNFALFEVAKNQLIQDKLFKEITTATNRYGGWSFESVEKMTYLDQVVKETLRLHCFNVALHRIVKKNYKIPETSFVLEEGLSVIIPIYAIHMDPQYYPNPDVFNPDRFYGNNNNSSSTFLPFGSGPRICIARKFANLVMKSYLAKVLYKYEVKISKNMVLPVEFEENEFYPKVKGGIWLEFSERKHSL